MLRSAPERSKKRELLSRMLLMFAPSNEDLTMRHLEILIVQGLPWTSELQNGLIAAAKIAGLIAVRLLKEAGQQVRMLYGIPEITSIPSSRRPS